MNTIDAFASDVELQLGFLEKFQPQKIQQNNVIFCGSGDSLCAALLAESFSNYTVRAHDPLELAKNKSLGRSKHAYFVSISGNTISTIRAAKTVRHSTAITRNSHSKLGKTCDGMILLDYVDSQILSSGSIGFLASALTCISLVHDFKIQNAKKLFQSAKSHTKKIIPKNQIYFLGNQYTYPIAMYASAKLGEILGMDSHYERIEQFSHMGLFSARPGDTVIIFEQTNSHIASLVSNLRKLGLYVHNPSIPSKNKIDQILYYTFVSQFISLYLARKKRIKDCYFITQKKTRAASSAMIY